MIYILTVLFIGLFGHEAKYEEVFPSPQECVEAGNKIAETTTVIAMSCTREVDL